MQAHNNESEIISKARRTNDFGRLRKTPNSLLQSPVPSTWSAKSGGASGNSDPLIVRAGTSLFLAKVC